MKKIWKITTLLIVVAIILNITGISIYAENTYFALPSETQVNVIKYYQSGRYLYQSVKANQDTRVVFIETDINTQYHRYYLVSLQPFSKAQLDNVGSFGTVGNNYNISATARTYNDVTYYAWQGTISSTGDVEINPEIPIYDYRGQNVDGFTMAYRYTYGDLSDYDEPAPIYGQLQVGYSVNIASNGSVGSGNNVDIITWDTYDTNGNDLTGNIIEIRAIAGDYEANTKNDLLNATFIRNVEEQQRVHRGAVSTQEVKLKWRDVADSLFPSLSYDPWGIWSDSRKWYSKGWLYQARIVDALGETLIDWQDIYQVTSTGVENTQVIVNSTTYSYELQQVINDINVINNTEQTWYIENNEITENTYDTQYQQNIIQNIYNLLMGNPDDEMHHKAEDVQQTIDNAIDTEDNYLNNLDTQLNDLELNDITQNNGLMKALRWVREVHHETIETTVYGPIVLTIMLIGLITYLIGRRNG